MFILTCIYLIRLVQIIALNPEFSNFDISRVLSIVQLSGP